MWIYPYRDGPVGEGMHIIQHVVEPVMNEIYKLKQLEVLSLKFS